MRSTVAASTTMKAFVATSLTLVFLLAGCSSPPPSGDLVAVEYSLEITGTVTPTFVAYSNPLDDTLPAGDPGVCDENTPMVPTGLECTPASTTVTGQLESPPEPNSGGYRAYLMGTAAEVDLGAFIPDEQNFMYDLSFTRDQDLSEGHTLIQVRMGDFVLAEAPISAAGGPAQFIVVQSATQTTVTGSYAGPELTVAVGGLPAGNTTYMGIFYKLGADGLTPEATSNTCPIINGANLCKLTTGNVADFVEFHVHVAGSKVNLAKMHIGPIPAPAA